MTLSLRTRLLLGIITGTAILLTVFSLIIYTVTQRTMIRNFDNSLLDTAKMLAASIAEDSGEHEQTGQHDDKSGSASKRSARKIELEFDVRMTPEFNTLDGGAYYQFWSQDGSISRSPSLGQQDLPRFGFASTGPEYRPCILPDGKAGRAVSYRFLRGDKENEPDGNPLPEEGMLTLVVAKEAAELYAHLGFLKWLLLGSSIAVVFMSTGIAYGVTHTSLRPIYSLVKKIESIREDNLGQHFSRADFPRELRPICECLDDLFQRLDASFQREKRFNADVAHELRTPLAGMLSTIEVCLSRHRESDEYKDSLQNCLQIVKSMNKMIDTLLTLSRLDSGQITIQKESISLKGIIDDSWRYFADKAYDKDIVFINSIEGDAVCESDKDRLGMVISNILDNAVEYTNHGGRIWTKAERDGNSIILSVSNTGCLLREEEVRHVFDFFWRKDISRTDTGTHCGIGLPVSRKIAKALGIDIDINLEKDDIFTVRLKIIS